MEDKKPVQTDPRATAPSTAQRGSPGDEAAQREQDLLSEQLANLRNAMEGDVLPDVNTFPTRDPRFHYFWASTTAKNDPIYRRQQIGYVFVRPEEFPELQNDFRVSEGQYAGNIGCNELVLMKIPAVLAQEMMKINHYERPLAEEQRIQSEAVRKEYRDRYGKELGGYAPEDEGFKNLGQRLKTGPTFSV